MFFSSIRYYIALYVLFTICTLVYHPAESKHYCFVTSFAHHPRYNQKYAVSRRLNHYEYEDI